jgi:hypothetical protein
MLSPVKQRIDKRWIAFESAARLALTAFRARFPLMRPKNTIRQVGAVPCRPQNEIHLHGIERKLDAALLRMVRMSIQPSLTMSSKTISLATARAQKELVDDGLGDEDTQGWDRVRGRALRTLACREGHNLGIRQTLLVEWSFFGNGPV